MENTPPTEPIYIDQGRMTPAEWLWLRTRAQQMGGRVLSVAEILSPEPATADIETSALEILPEGPTVSFVDFLRLAKFQEPNEESAKQFAGKAYTALLRVAKSQSQLHPVALPTLVMNIPIQHISIYRRRQKATLQIEAQSLGLLAEEIQSVRDTIPTKNRELTMWLDTGVHAVGPKILQFWRDLSMQALKQAGGSNKMDAEQA